MIENIDYFYCSAGKVQEIKCRTCQTICEVERKREGSTVLEFYIAQENGLKIPKEDDYHDRFMCPHIDEEWHCAATRLVKQMWDSDSPTLKEIMQKDLNKIAEENLK